MAFLKTLLFLCVTTIISLIYFFYKNNKRKNELENLLDNQREFDNTLLDAIPQPIFYKNTKGEYLGCNKAFSDLLKISKDNIKGKKAEDFFSKEWVKESDIVDYNLLHNSFTKISEKTLHIQGDEKPLQFVVTKSTFYNINRTIGGIVGVMDDVTERTRQKQFLIQQSKLAEMGDMVAAIAHQWNEPLVELSAILQDLNFSYKNKTLNEKELDEYVKDSMRQIQYMSETLRDFRNFLKPSTKKITFDIKKSIDKLLEIIQRQIKYFYINLDIKYSPKYSVISIYGYENEFMQVLLNIINNAKSKIVAKQKETNIKNGQISISVWQEYDSTFIDISDNAGGIKSEVVNQMFDPYFSTKKEGTGLGLYMAKVIIEEKMDGKISVFSEPNSATFRIEVPNKPTKIDLE